MPLVFNAKQTNYKCNSVLASCRTCESCDVTCTKEISACAC